jgi:hypothetical protein
LCPLREGSEWHNLNCVKELCDNCRIHLLPVCQQELDVANTKLMDWKRFEMVLAGKTRKGEPKKVVRLEYKTTMAREFLEYAAPKLMPFILHQHNARWQDAQCKKLLEGLKVEKIINFIDFAENYSFKG